MRTKQNPNRANTCSTSASGSSERGLRRVMRKAPQRHQTAVQRHQFLERILSPHCDFEMQMGRGIPGNSNGQRENFGQILQSHSQLINFRKFARGRFRVHCYSTPNQNPNQNQSLVVNQPIQVSSSSTDSSTHDGNENEMVNGAPSENDPKTPHETKMMEKFQNFNIKE